MTVIVFSKNPNSSRMKFPRRPRTGPQVEVHPVSRLRKLLPSLEQGQLVYLDMAGLGEVDRRRLLAALAKRPGIFFAVIDPLAKVSDIASLFHAGAVDYMGREFRRTGLTARRLDRVMAFARASHGQPTALAAPAEPPEPQSAEKRPGRDGWAGIVAGREHPFAFLFVEVDNIEAIKRRCGADNLSKAMETFRAFIERMVTQHGGRLWTWAGFGGLILFPLRSHPDDDDSAAGASPLLCMLRVALARILYDVEESPLPAILSFRMALSTGSMVYRERDTGAVIAESLNAIFHLGQKYTGPGQFFLTEDALGLAPERLRSTCVPVGSFEGRRIHRMVIPRYPAFHREGEWSAGD